LGNNYF